MQLWLVIICTQNVEVMLWWTVSIPTDDELKKYTEGRILGENNNCMYFSVWANEFENCLFLHIQIYLFSILRLQEVNNWIVIEPAEERKGFVHGLQGLKTWLYQDTFVQINFEFGFRGKNPTTYKISVHTLY